MTPQSLSILLTFLSISAFALPILGAADLDRSPLVGSYRPIKDPNDPEIVRIAKFAVEEHNKQAKTSLIFQKVISGEQQVVSGINYRLKISAASGGAAVPETYEAVVYSRPWEKFQQLISFQASR